jgi:hypothetical protein
MPDYVYRCAVLYLVVNLAGFDASADTAEALAGQVQNRA